MIHRIISFFNTYNINKATPLLVAVSGGKDSMTLLYMLAVAEYNINVAHINHSTRNGESDVDETFVKAFCEDKNIPFYSKKLDYKSLSKGNFQENARQARKSFLEKILLEQNLKYILTAHHSDDHFETVMMNLQRGSGLSGMTGIDSFNPPYLRPMLDISRAEIDHFQQENDIPYREDESNQEDDYLRNRLRHHLTPIAKKILPNIITGTRKTAEILSKEQNLLLELIDNLKASFVHSKDGLTYFDLEKIQAFEHKTTLVYYLLKPYGFDLTQTENIISSQTGGKIMNIQYEVLKDRNQLILRKRTEEIEAFEVKISAFGSYDTPWGNICISDIETDEIPRHLTLPSDIIFPLTIRKWKAGDHFKPQGMNGKTKKVKKYLTDLKLSQFEKEKVLVLLQNDKIIQIIGYRNGIIDLE